ncbi:hypothetical protein FQN60_006766 [Etheostoma spectabile]|uniref:Uncharacterized protein n=1 Tax=Etheostoma spectabile TaxID=54343 RepID=A0A5J5CF79_9PERO|nr:hypothetical protein FQN60_006766 [Etheostoma spectabile]
MDLPAAPRLSRNLHCGRNEITGRNPIPSNELGLDFNMPVRVNVLQEAQRVSETFFTQRLHAGAGWREQSPVQTFEVFHGELRKPKETPHLHRAFNHTGDSTLPLRPSYH